MIPGTLLTRSEDRRFPVAINRGFVDKDRVDVRFTAFETGWETEYVDYSELKDVIINHGWAIARPLSGGRRIENVTHVSYLCLDFDSVSEAQFEEIKQHPLIKGRGFFHYSASHGKKPGINGHWICPLEQEVKLDSIGDKTAWGSIFSYIVSDIKSADKNAVDLPRLFYGAKNKGYEIWGDEYIPLAELEPYFARVEEAMRTNRTRLRRSERARGKQIRYTLEDAIRFTEEYVSPQIAAGGMPAMGEWDSYMTWNAYFVGWVDMIGLEKAGWLMDHFAPDSTMTGYEKISSFLKDDTKRHFLFGSTKFILNNLGWSEAGKVFGADEIKPDKVIDTSGRDKPWIMYSDIQPDNFESCVLVKSPKGTGKTEIIKEIIGTGMRVLIIGHRRALLRNMSQRLGIPNYQDVVPFEQRSIAVTVDSLDKLDVQRQQFDVVIIDEIEQVLQHCIGDTLKDSRATLLSIFQFVLRKAYSVYGFDADLSNVSINFMARHLGRNRVFVIENTARLGNRRIELYDNVETLQNQVYEDLKAGLKVAIGSNSKQYVDVLERRLMERFPDKVLWSVTSDTSNARSVDIANISEESLKYDAILFSPSLGTGVSIDNDHFDVMYLFGYKGVSTHFDLDQQANRVRRLKSNTVRAFIAPRYLGDEVFETEAQQIKQTLVATAAETGVRVKIHEDGTVEADTSDGWYLELYADIQSLRNRSMNNLRGNFAKLMTEQGNDVVDVKSNKEVIAVIREENKKEKQAMEDAYIEAVSGAVDIDGLDYSELNGKDMTTFEEKAQMVKFELKQFYRVDVTPELVVLDDKGSFRPRVRLAEMVTGYDSAEAFDSMEQSLSRGLSGYESKVMLPHRQFYVAKKRFVNEMLEVAGFGAFEKPLSTWAVGRSTSALVLKRDGFVEWLLERQEFLKSHFGITLKANFEDAPVAPISELLIKFGLSLEMQRKGRTAYGPGSGWSYTVNREGVLRLEAILEARKEAFAPDIDVEELARALVLVYERDGRSVETKVPLRMLIDYAGTD